PAPAAATSEGENKPAEQAAAPAEPAPEATTATPAAAAPGEAKPAETTAAAAKPGEPKAGEPAVATTPEPKPEEVKPAAPPKPPPAPPASIAFRGWVENLKIAGVRGGANPRVFVGKSSYSPGDLVNPQLGITFDGYNPETRMLTFKDKTGAKVERRN
ncbi:MAG TPA: hypothetical protein VG734_20710, partial [Lacunisphaera sp.]|nr:hypothetical protein [Lacunisphaera sp.]